MDFKNQVGTSGDVQFDRVPPQLHQEEAEDLLTKIRLMKERILPTGMEVSPDNLFIFSEFS